MKVGDLNSTQELDDVTSDQVRRMACLRGRRGDDGVGTETVSIELLDVEQVVLNNTKKAAIIVLRTGYYSPYCAKTYKRIFVM